MHSQSRLKLLNGPLPEDIQALAQQGGVPSAPVLRRHQQAHRDENRIIEREDEIIHETIRTVVNIWEYD